MFTQPQNLKNYGQKWENDILVDIPNPTYVETVLVKDYVYETTKTGKKSSRNQEETRLDVNGLEYVNAGLALRNIFNHTVGDLIVENKIFTSKGDAVYQRGLHYENSEYCSNWVNNIRNNKDRKLTFKNCIFNSLEFRFCQLSNVEFINCQFINLGINGNSFISGCSFIDCKFENLTVYSCEYNIRFSSCKFTRTIIEYGYVDRHSVIKCEFDTQSRIIVTIPEYQLLFRGAASEYNKENATTDPNREICIADFAFNKCVGITDTVLHTVIDHTQIENCHRNNTFILQVKKEAII